MNIEHHLKSVLKLRKLYGWVPLLFIWNCHNIINWLYSSVTQLFLTLCNSMDCSTQASMSLTTAQSLPKFMFIASVMLSSRLILFSFCPWSFPASGTFPMSCLFISGDQNPVVSASASVLPGNIQSWCPSRLTGMVSMLSKGLTGVINSLAFCLLYSPVLTATLDSWEDHSFVHRPLSAE